MDVRIKSPKYEYQVGVLKQYHENHYKLTKHKCLRICGVEDDEIVVRAERGTANEKKLLDNIKRAEQKIREYGYCNPWDMFVTLTIDQSKHDRYDLKSYYRAFSQWLRNYQRKHRINIKYLLVPEQHKDGAWHMHGFFYGLPVEHLEVNSHGYYDWLPYRRKFGYISIDFIRDKARAASYISKYVSKNISALVSDLNQKMYYCSHGLKTAEIIKKGPMTDIIDPLYSNEYVQVKYYTHPREALQHFD